MAVAGWCYEYCGERPDALYRRELGAVPFSTAKLVETKSIEENWAFCLGGEDYERGRPILVVGDDAAIPGLLPGASAPELHDDTTMGYTLDGEAKTTRLGVLLGTKRRSTSAAHLRWMAVESSNLGFSMAQE
jgi:hypothetical protein